MSGFTHLYTFIDLSFSFSVKLCEGILNVQHNCRKAQCQVQKTRLQFIERTVTSIQGYQVVHNNYNSYLLNSGALCSAALHRQWAGIDIPCVTPGGWKRAISKGLRAWQDEMKTKKEKKKLDAAKAAALDNQSTPAILQVPADGVEVDDEDEDDWEDEDED